jgi:hypothetical protein
LAIALAGSYVAATPWLRPVIRLYLLEYRERQKQLLGMKASVLSTWETLFAALERQSATAARLLSLPAFLNFGASSRYCLSGLLVRKSWQQQ